MAVRVLSWLDHPCAGRERGHQPVDRENPLKGLGIHLPARIAFWFADRGPDGIEPAVPIDAGGWTVRRRRSRPERVDRRASDAATDSHRRLIVAGLESGGGGGTPTDPQLGWRHAPGRDEGCGGSNR